MSGDGPSNGWEHRGEPSRPVPPAAPPPQPPSAVASPTNGLAVASLVCGIVWAFGLGSVAALVLGYMARSQIDRSGGREGGRGLAVAGIVLGWIGVAGLLLSLLAFGCLASVGDTGGDVGEPIILDP